jgi:hypothetical protein
MTRGKTGAGRRIMVAMMFTVVSGIARPASVEAQSGQQRPSDPEGAKLDDRGPGVPTSMFGTYVRKGELLVYPFYEYYRDGNLEYAPEEFGVPGDVDYRARYRAHEGLLFLGYGITEDLAVEFEMAAIRAQFDKSPLDESAVPSRIEESGLGDIEGQIRWRFRRETARRPELFSYGEVVVPHHGDKPLIGTADWELAAGIGVVRGYSWGTLTARAALEFAAASTSPFDLGEYALEYLKRLSPAWRVYVGLEGSSDELSLITEAQWHVSDRVFLRLNSGLGLTSKATDWAPEIGMVFSFPSAPTPWLRVP